MKRTIEEFSPTRATVDVARIIVAAFSLLLPFAVPASAQSFDVSGKWDAEYYCHDGRGTGESTYSFQEDGPNGITAVEQYQWIVFGMEMLNTVQYRGFLKGNKLYLTSLPGVLAPYRLRLTISEDGDSMRGVYIGHPNCDSAVLQRLQN